MNETNLKVKYRSFCGLIITDNGIIGTVKTVSEDGDTRVSAVKDDCTYGGVNNIIKYLKGKNTVDVAIMGDGESWMSVLSMLQVNFDLHIADQRCMHKLPPNIYKQETEWLAELLKCGLLKKQHVRSNAFRELRELTRTREILIRKITNLERERNSIVNKSCCKYFYKYELNSFMKSMLGSILTLKKNKEITKTAKSYVQNQEFILKLYDRECESLYALVKKLNTKIRKKTRNVQEQICRLCTIPGIHRRFAEAIIGEIGVDLTRFQDYSDFVDWAGETFGLSSGQKKRSNNEDRDSCLKQVIPAVVLSVIKNENSSLSHKYALIASEFSVGIARASVEYVILMMVYKIILENRSYWEIVDNIFIETAHLKENVGYVS